MKLLLTLLILFISSALHSLTLEEKVGQLLMVNFRGTIANEQAQRLIEEAHVGGFIFYNWANELQNEFQAKELCHSLQSLSKIPLWLSLDQEGGPVSRLHWLPYPGNRALSQLSLQEAEECAFQLAQQLRALGINMNLAPVVDISSNPSTSYIAKRTFGNTPEIVIPYAQAVLNGFKKGNVVAVLKHFPGYGDATTDPHTSLPIISKSKQDLNATELAPYRALAPQADAIMTAHLLIPSLDKDNCATLSHKIITSLLKEELSFQGLVITDSLVMDGLLYNNPNIEEAAIQAILAGCDLLILGGKKIIDNHPTLELTTDQQIAIFQALLHAAQDGRISIERLNEAVERNLSLKEKFAGERQRALPHTH